MQSTQPTPISELIRDPTAEPLQVFLTDRLQLGAVLQQMLVHTQAADIHISTFSVGEEFLRKLIALRGKGHIKSATLYTDLRGAEKTARIRAMLYKAFDKVVMTQIHAKLIIAQGERCTATLLTSQNTTRGNRVESYTLIHNDTISQNLLSCFNHIKGANL